MSNLSEKIIHSFEESGLNVGELRKAQRTAWVRTLWSNLVEPHILEHTNGVYIFHHKGILEMHIYMDDSLYASEISNRSALIYQECRLKYNEPIEEVCVHVSQGQRKKQYPFIEQKKVLPDQNDPIPLNNDEINMVDEACKCIPDPQLQARFRQAMISDLEWKKGNK